MTSMGTIPSAEALDKAMLDIAARLACRGMGDVEPNPMVGCVIGSMRGEILGMGHHRRLGEAHAEALALNDCRRRGRDPRGACVWVTLEPCAHTGRTPPCADALIEAGVSRVVMARRDPHDQAQGGAERLRQAGIEVVLSEAGERAKRVSDPFVKRVTTGLPWVMAKWAQTIDGRIATRSGDSKWISNATSRRAVHRLRARVDVILTGIGTVRADDPLLTARGVSRVRRVARRVVVDPALSIDLDRGLLKSLDQAPLSLACEPDALRSDRAEALAARGVELLGVPVACGRLDLAELLRQLVDRHDATNVLVEAGPGLMTPLMDQELVDQLLVFVAPRLMGDERGLAPVRGRTLAEIAAAERFTLDRVSRFADDALLIYRRETTGGE